MVCLRLGDLLFETHCTKYNITSFFLCSIIVSLWKVGFKFFGFKNVDDFSPTDALMYYIPYFMGHKVQNGELYRGSSITHA